MTTPFAPWANAAFILGMASAVLFASAVVAAPMLYIRTDYGDHEHDIVEQPVEFDHRHHVQDEGIACQYCHDGADDGARAGIPPTSVCMGCHGQVWPESPQLSLVRASYFENRPIPWKRVYQLPDHVYFHHGVHVSAGVDCAACHGAVRDMARIRRHVPLTMKFCLDCHRGHQSPPGREVTGLTTCTACHR